MVARSTSNHVNAIDQVEFLERKPQLIDIELTRGRQAPNKRIAHDARLLAYLLEHKIGIAAFLGHIDVPIDMRNGGGDNRTLGIGVFNTLRG